MLLAELKRRRVVRVLIAYLAAAFIVVQVADLVLPALQLPEWTYRLIVLLALLGLPIVVVLAWVFDWREGGVVRTEPAARPLPKTARAALVIVVAAACTATAWILLRPEPAQPLDDALIAVTPFRIAGSHADLWFLREGMLDLLATKISTSPRVVDSRTMISHWRRFGGADDSDLPQDSAALIARALGAGRLVLGAVVGTPARFTISATLLDVASGRRLAITSVTAVADSVQDAVDDLAAALLSLSAGETEERLAALTSTSAAALRAYLGGKRRYRRGEYEAAAREFQRALREDSTFALAGIGLVEAAQMGVETSLLALVADGSRTARANRERLSASDRMYLDVLLLDDRDLIEQLHMRQRAAREQPDRPEIHYLLGDLIFHFGRVIDVQDHAAQARSAFRDALRLDPDFFVARQHFVWTAQLLGDTALVRQDGYDLLATLDGGESAEYLRLQLGSHLDPELWDSLTTDLHALSSSALIGIAYGGAFPLVQAAYEDSRNALDILQRRAVTEVERTQAAELRHAFAANHGLPGEARTASRELQQLTKQPRSAARRALLDALYWDADTTVANAAAAELEPLLTRSFAEDAPTRQRQVVDLCTLEQWRVTRNETATALRSAQRIVQAGDALPASARRHAAVCALLLETLHAYQARADALPARLQQLDSLLQRGPRNDEIRTEANIALGRMLAATGDFAGARVAFTRREIAPSGVMYYSTRLREEGRMADRLGEREAAIAAYTKYLELHAHAEPGLRSQTDQVRAALAALVQH